MGTNITALIRDALMIYANMPASEAQKIADKVTAENIDPMDWIVTSRGLTFDRGFDPARPSAKNND